MSENNSVRFGATSWDEVEIHEPKKQRTNSKDLFMKLAEGPNVIRIITKPHEYLVHNFKVDPKDPGFGDKINSSLAHGRDPLTEAPYNSKPKRRWLVGIIDRRTGGYRILDMSSSVFRGIQELVRDSDWGDPSQFDISVNVKKDAGPAGYYTVVPKSKRPLSASDLQIKQQVDVEDLKRRCTPPTPEEVQKRLDFILSKRNKTNGGSSTTETSSTDHSSGSVDMSDSDEFDFPAVN